MLNIYTTPCGIPSAIFWLLLSSYVCWIIRFFLYWFLFLFIADVFCFADVLCFELRSYVCKILGLYHVLMFVCRVHQFVVPRFFCLYRLPTYVDPSVFFVLRSYVCKILGLNHVLMYVNTYVPRLLISIAYDFYACTEFPRMWNSTIFLLVLNSYIRRSNILFQLRIKCVVTTRYLSDWFSS